MQLDNFLPEQVCDLIDTLNRLPSVGRRSAQRLAFFILKEDLELSQEIADALLNAKTKTLFCDICFNLSSQTESKLCQSGKRIANKICVVEGVLDLIAIERAGVYDGLYHVLHGVLSPLDGVTPKHLRINELTSRIQDLNTAGNQVELILATPTTPEGDATNIYISQMLKDFNLNITKLASGLPHGGILDYADELTLKNAFTDRKNY